MSSDGPPSGHVSESVRDRADDTDAGSSSDSSSSSDSFVVQDKSDAGSGESNYFDDDEDDDELTSYDVESDTELNGDESSGEQVRVVEPALGKRKRE